MNIQEEKNKLRKKLLKERNLLSYKEVLENSKELKTQLINFFHMSFPQVIHSYLSINNEISTDLFLQHAITQGSTIVIPKIKGDHDLIHLKLKNFQNIQTGTFNTRLPTPEIEYKGSFDCILVPGLAFSEKRERLGYGGGFYDRFLKAHPKAMKIGVCHSRQILNYVPTENHDQQMDYVITN